MYFRSNFIFYLKLDTKLFFQPKINFIHRMREIKRGRKNCCARQKKQKKRHINLIIFRLNLDENPLTHLFWVKRVIQLPQRKRLKNQTFIRIQRTRRKLAQR